MTLYGSKFTATGNTIYFTSSTQNIAIGNKNGTGSTANGYYGSVVFTFPLGLASGTYTITASNGQATPAANTITFSILPAQTTTSSFNLTSLSPSSGPAGSTVNIIGNQFTQSGNIVHWRNSAGSTQDITGTAYLTSLPEEQNREIAMTDFQCLQSSREMDTDISLIPRAEAVVIQSDPTNPTSGDSTGTCSNGQIPYGGGCVPEFGFCGCGGSYPNCAPCLNDPCEINPILCQINEQTFCNYFNQCVASGGDPTRPCDSDIDCSQTAPNPDTSQLYCNTLNQCVLSGDTSRPCDSASDCSTSGPTLSCNSSGQCVLGGGSRSCNSSADCTSTPPPPSVYRTRLTFTVPSDAQAGIYTVSVKNGQGTESSNSLSFQVTASGGPSSCTIPSGNIFGSFYGQDMGTSYFEPVEAAALNQNFCFNFGASINSNLSLTGTAFNPQFGLINFAGSSVIVGTNASALTGTASFENYTINLGTPNPNTDCSTVYPFTSTPPAKTVICINNSTGSWFGWILHPIFGYLKFDNVRTSWRPQTSIAGLPTCSYNLNDFTTKQNGLMYSWLTSCGPSFAQYLNGIGVRDTTISAMLLLQGTGSNIPGGTTQPISGTEPSETSGAKTATTNTSLVVGGDTPTNITRTTNPTAIKNIAASLIVNGSPLPSQRFEGYTNMTLSGNFVRQLSDKFKGYICLLERSGIHGPQLIHNLHLNEAPLLVSDPGCGLTGSETGADTTPPVVLITPVTANTTQSTVNLRAVDDVGVTDAAYDIGTPASAATASAKHFTSTKNNIVVPAGSTLYWWAKDAAGNIGTGASLAPGGGENTNSLSVPLIDGGGLGNLPPPRPGVTCTRTPLCITECPSTDPDAHGVGCFMNCTDVLNCETTP